MPTRKGHTRQVKSKGSSCLRSVTVQPHYMKKKSSSGTSKKKR